MIKILHQPLKACLTPAVESLERLRLTSNLSHQQWFDLLGMNWTDYQSVRTGLVSPPKKSFENLAQHFGVQTEALANGAIDFKALERRLSLNQTPMPERYTKAAYGRSRTSIISVDFLEERFGWRLRLDALRSLGVAESHLCDAFAPISMSFITDLCSYLGRRQFQSSDFFSMGAYNFSGNRNTIVARIFSEMRSTKELYEFFCGEAIRLFEKNCSYTIKALKQDHLIIDILTNPHVAAESGVRHLGSAHVCDLKRGLISHLPLYMGLPSARITETRCVHRGDSVCRFEVDMSLPERTRLSPLSA